VQRHFVVLCGLLLIVVQLAWKASFLAHENFRQDDFFLIDLANRSRFGWAYLTYTGSGQYVGTDHLIIGPKALVWVVARVWGYNWGVASAISLVLLAATSVAGLRLLRTLFGNRPAILIPLAVYVFTPLTLADFGWWASAIESVPLQLATFMALTSHVLYVRTGRTLHMVAASIWVAVGLLCFEKGLLLPLLLFGVTSAFLTEGRTWLAGIFLAARRYWRAWVIYAAMMIAYAVLLTHSLAGARVPKAATVSQTLSFVEVFVKDNFIAGALGGPWTWFPTPDRSYALAAPPTVLTWLALVIAVIAIVVSVLRSKKAVRAWVILAGWLVGDMIPVIVARLSDWPPAVLALETRYAADAAPVLAICLGLAYWPVTGQQAQAAGKSQHGHQRPVEPPPIAGVGRPLAAGLAVLLLVGAVWSGVGYEHATSGASAATYLSNARLALGQAPAGLVVLDGPVPNPVINLFGSVTETSAVLGVLERGSAANKLRWTVSPEGTVDNLMMFGPDGKLHLALVYGASTTALPSRDLGCWPVHQGRIVANFGGAAPVHTTILRLGYIWRPPVPGTITVGYGRQYFRLPVRPGLHTAYLHVTGTASAVVVTGFAGSDVCLGNAEAGNLGIATAGPTYPAS
jgi:hypothetical protein